MANWVMRTVVEKLERPGRYPRERLSCGHEVVDRDYLYGNEKAVQIRAMGRALAGQPTRRRCYECANSESENA